MTHPSIFRSSRLACAVAAFTLCTAAHAAPVQVTVTIKNLVPANGVSFAPLRLGFNNGSFDAFNLGQVATAPIVSVTEGGSGSDWFPAFAAADPTATLGSIAMALTPGQTRSSSFTVDSAVNRYFTFASMVVPSNDLFIGNDDPMEYELFDTAGNLNITSIGVKAGEIWDAGSEAFDPLNAAFLPTGTNALRTPQNSVVGFNFAELAAFNGLTTAAGYVVDSQLRANSDVYSISFSVAAVPEPDAYALMLGGLMTIGWVARRRRVPSGASI